MWLAFLFWTPRIVFAVYFLGVFFAAGSLLYHYWKEGRWPSDLTFGLTMTIIFLWYPLAVDLVLTKIGEAFAQKEAPP
jgi:hypothetical protein